MTIAYILVGAIVGVAIGYLIGQSAFNKKKAEFEEALDAARKDAKSAQEKMGASVEEQKAKLAKIEEKLAAATELATRHKTKLEETKQQLEQQRAALTQAEAARAQAAEAAEAHKMARQQADGRCKQAEAMVAQAQQQIREVGAQIDRLQQENAGLRETTQRQTRETQRLRAEVSSSRPAGAGLEESLGIFDEASGSLEGILHVIVEREGQNAAVVADSNGIIVAAAGEGALREGIAATAQLVRSSVRQFEGMVPFEDLRAYSLQDQSSNVIAGRFFKCAGEHVGLATYGPRLPNERVLDGAMANLTAILE